jgi:hypothetical protein
LTDFSGFAIQIVSYVDGASSLNIERNVVGIENLTTNGLDLARVAKVEMAIAITGAASFLETRFNTRWARGQKVELYLRLSTGAFALHRTLFIIDSQHNRSFTNPQLKLRLGCIFAYKDSRRSPPGDLKIPVLENTPDVAIKTTVNYWLRTFGIPEITYIVGDYQPTERLFTTETYSGGSSIVDHLGMIILNCRGVLWADAQGRVRLREITLTPTVINYAISPRDLPERPPIDGEREKVAGTVRVLGVANYRFPYVDPTFPTSYTTEGDLQTEENYSITTTANSRVITRSGTVILGTADTGKIGQYNEVWTEAWEGGFAAQVNPNPLYPNIPAFPPWLTTKTYALQEQRLGADGKLGPLQTTKTMLTKWQHRITSTRHEGMIVKGAEVSQQYDETKILPEGETVLRIEQSEKQNWQYLAPGIYYYNSWILRPESVDNRRYSKVKPSIGESTPPSITSAPRTTVPQQIEIFGEAKFSYPPGAPDNDHPRDYPVGGYVDSKYTAKKIAEQLGGLLIGRNEAEPIAIRPSDAHIIDPYPYPIVAIAYSATEQEVYLLDVPIWLFGARSQLGGNGLYLGRRTIATGAITPPYELKQTVIGYGTKQIGYGTKLFAAGRT